MKPQRLEVVWQGDLLPAPLPITELRDWEPHSRYVKWLERIRPDDSKLLNYTWEDHADSERAAIIREA